MSVIIEFHGNIALIKLSGALDYSTQNEIQVGFTQALSAENVTELEVDFTEVKFLDSSIIRALFMLQTKVKTDGKSLVLMNCSDPVLLIFEIGGFDAMFTIRRQSHTPHNSQTKPPGSRGNLP